MDIVTTNKFDKKVRQSNHFVESPYAQEFTATELKILEIAVSNCKIADKTLVEKENNKKFEFTTKELANLLNTSVSTLSHEAERLSKSIIKKYIHARRELPDGNVEFETIAIIPYTKYENGIFSFELNHKLLHYFIEINGGFTEYSLRYLMTLKSAYAIKLYKLLFQYRKIKERKFEVEDLRTQFGIDKKKYKLYSDFKRRILDFSVYQINLFTDLEVTYVEIKIRNKISQIKFSFDVKQAVLESKVGQDKKINTELRAVIDDIEDKIEEDTKDVLLDYYNKQGIVYVESCIKYAKKRSTSNFDAYLKTTLAKNHAEIEVKTEIKKIEKKQKINNIEQKIKQNEDKERERIFEEVKNKFMKLSSSQRTIVTAELIKKISKICPDKLPEILEKTDDYSIAYWARANNLVYYGEFHIKLDAWKILSSTIPNNS